MSAELLQKGLRRKTRRLRMSNIKIKNQKVLDREIPEVMDIRDYLDTIEKFGDKILFKYFEGKEVVEVSYKQFSDDIKAFSAGLDAYDLKDKRIAVIGETSVKWFTSYAAILAVTSVAVPMDKELAVNEIMGLFDSVEGDAIVYSPAFNNKFAEYTEKYPNRKFIAMDDTVESHDNVIRWADVLEKGREAVKNGYEYPKVKPFDEMCEMLFTSGTTGTSKCVMLSQRNIFSVISSAVATVPFVKDDVILSVLPLHHTYELACSFAASTLGMTICINDSIRHIMRNIATFRPTGLVLVPLFVSTMYKKVWTEAKKQKKDKALKMLIKVSEALRKVGIDLRGLLFKSVTSAFGGRLQKIICGGAKLNPELIEGFEAFGIPIYEGFGITECAPLTAVTPYYARRVGSIGRCVPCCHMRVEPNGQISDDGYPLGEIQVKGYNVMIGYYNNPKANEEVFTSDGWFRTGDIGYVDKDGYYFITGRSKFVIVLENGKNVFPEEIEDYLGNIEGIAECVVLGRHKDGGDEVVLTAVVYPDANIFANGESQDEILKTLRKKINELNATLPSFKQIKAVELRETEFEKTTSRKIKRHLVK